MSSLHVRIRTQAGENQIAAAQKWRDVRYIRAVIRRRRRIDLESTSDRRFARSLTRPACQLWCARVHRFVIGIPSRPMISRPPIKALVLRLEYAHRVSYYDDWSDAFAQSRHFRTQFHNVLSPDVAELRQRIDEHDAVIMLHGCNSDTLEFLEPIVPALAQRKRAKVLSFVGNEFNSPYVSANRRVELLHQARVDIVATQLLQEAGDYLYAGTGAKVISVPHALNPAAFKPGPDHGARRLDIGVKGYKYPPYLGDDDRNRFIEHFERLAPRLGLAVDISFDNRIGRQQWSAFLQSCRATVSTEVGSWYISPDDTLITQIHDYLKAKRQGFVITNDSIARRAARRLPPQIKWALWKVLKLGVVKFDVLDDFSTPFAEVDREFFQKVPRSPAYGKAISSRHFDAVGTQTCQVMLRGRYSDILNADEHYVAVDPDLANADDAVRRLKDPLEWRAIVTRAYDHVMSAHTYAHRAAAVYDALDAL
jgi:hypothetical protein